MKKIYIIWEYDNGIMPEKTLVFACETLETARKEAKKLQKGMPDYTYEIETTTLKK